MLDSNYGNMLNEYIPKAKKPKKKKETFSPWNKIKSKKEGY